MKLLKNFFVAILAVSAIGLTVAAHAVSLQSPTNCLKEATIDRSPDVFFEYDVTTTLPNPLAGELAVSYNPAGDFVQNPNLDCLGSAVFCCVIIDQETDEVIASFRKD